MQSVRPATLLAPLAAAGLLAACLPFGPKEPPMPTGQEDYTAVCATCHGPTGLGDGPSAAGLPKKPANLTVLAKNNGGVFPTTAVMAQIWGYSGGGKNGSVMPSFAPLLEGSQMVLYDGGDGIATPTPIRLVQVAEYVKSLQVK